MSPVRRPGPDGHGLSRRALLTATGAIAAGAVAGPLLLAERADAEPSPLRLLRNANSGDPAARGTDRWQVQVLQADLPRPPRSAVSTQLRYASAFVRRSDPDGVTQCVPPRDVPTSWLLTDDAGELITRDGGDDVAIDVGNRDFQEAAARHLVAECRAGGTWAGVHHDEINASFDWGWPGRTPARYPTGDGWRAALLEHVSHLATRLAEAGFSLVGNLGSARATNDDWYVDVVLHGMVPSLEYFVCGETGEDGTTPYLAPPAWERHLRYIDLAEANRAGSPAPQLASGERILIHERQDRDDVVLYSLASYLLASSGRGLSAYGADVAYSAGNTPYPAVYGQAAQLGYPTGTRVQLGDTVWGRQFERGWVLVNNGSSAASHDGYPLEPHTGLVTRTG